MTKHKRWTKQCACGLFMPDEYDLCDQCVLRHYGLGLKGRHDHCDQLGLGPTLFEEKDVVEALRAKGVMGE